MAKTTAERRKFQAHDNLLVDVIKRQAGSLSKAVAEAVMNSADAILSEDIKGGFCRVTLTETSVTVEDNGKGFRSKKEVIEWFGKFGTPHDASENKTFGTFRAGRGQLFAFGKNVWRSGKMKMTVDVVKDSLDYDLETGLDHHPGCRIEIALYNPLSEYDLNVLNRDLGKWFKYAPVPVTINGELITVDPATEKWDLDLPEAYVRLRQNDSYLAVYNLGVYVRDEYGYNIGAGGVLVSKKQLALNFARNEVLRSDCAVWAKVSKAVKAQVDKIVLAGKKLTKDQLTAVLSRAVAGDRVDGFEKLRVLVDCNGRRYTLAEFREALPKYRRNLSFAPAADRAADRLLQTNACLVLDESVLTMLGARDTNFLHRLTVAGDLSTAYFLGTTVVSFTQARSGLVGDQAVVDEREQSVAVRVWLDVARRAMSELSYAGRRTLPRDQLYARAGKRSRRLLVGESPTCDGWTDGKTYVVLNRVFLEQRPFTVQGLSEIGVLLAHELAHDDATDGTHHHGVEFYEEFEFLCQHGLSQFVSHGLRVMHGSVRQTAARARKMFKTDTGAIAKAAAAFETALADLRAMSEPLPGVNSAEPVPTE